MTARKSARSAPAKKPGSKPSAKSSAGKTARKAARKAAKKTAARPAVVDPKEESARRSATRKAARGAKTRKQASPKARRGTTASRPAHGPEEGHREIIGPASSYYVSQRLRLHYVDWGNEDKPLLILIHGGRDHARSWDWVARELRNEWHVIAPDLRGHGDSSWAIGGHYTMSEFVLDIAQLLDTLDEFPVTIVGHSLGGAVSIQYTAVYPERVSKLVSIEGLGPPPDLIQGRLKTPLWVRTDDWIQQVRSFSGRLPRRYPSIDAAAERMLDENSFLSPEQAHHLTVHGVARNEDGTYTWKFDNYVRIFYPQRWDVGEMRAMWGRITCPTLLMRGTESWAGDPSLDGRADAFQNVSLANVERAGHWVHHDQLDEFIRLVRDFIA